MPVWYSVDWQELFVPSKPLLEIMIRGTCTYLALFIMLRVSRRQAGSLGAADLLVLLLIADAAQNAMANNYSSITDGLLLVGTIVFWEYMIDWLGFHIPWLGRWIDREPLLLVQDGRVLEKNLQQELMTQEDLISQLRQKGIDNVAAVRKSYLEGDGSVSVITSNSNNSMQSDPNDAATE